MNRAGPWPTVNQRIEVHTAVSSAWLPSRVEDRQDRRLVVVTPCDARGTLVNAGTGEPVALRWMEPTGLARLDTTLTDERDGRVPVWELRADEAPVLHQRRCFARVAVVLPVRVMGGGGQSLLLSLDLSEGGVLCVASPTVAFEPGDRVELTLEVDGRRLQTPATVVRSRVAPGGATVAFRFLALPRRDADHLRRFVYTRQLHLASGGRR